MNGTDLHIEKKDQEKKKFKGCTSLTGTRLAYFTRATAVKLCEFFMLTILLLKALDENLTEKLWPLYTSWGPLEMKGSAA